MPRWWLGSMLCISLLSLTAQRASAAFPGFPSFPTVDDHRVVYGGNIKTIDETDDDVTDDDPVVPIKMTHMRVRSEIALRYARTAVICKVYNPNKRPQEASFNVLLPETAFISGFTMTLGKETYEAYVKEKEVAKQIYNDAVTQGVAAAHVATKARDSNHFQIKFNVEGWSNATYHMKYEEYLERRHGVYNYAINLLPGALVPKMDVIINIKESQKITMLRVPELRTGNEIDASEKDAKYNKAVIQRGENERQAKIIFAPDLKEQKRLAEIYAEKTKLSGDPDSWNIGYDSTEIDEKQGLLGQFVVQYDVEQPKNGEILVNDGYFVHFFAPSSLQPLSKHVVFVLDISGSMYGTKIDQLKKAMDTILSDLHADDYFNIIEFNGYIKVYDIQEPDKSQRSNFTSNALVSLVPPARASAENIAKAKVVVSKLEAYGGTDIYNALDAAINIVQKGDLEMQSTNVSSVKNNNKTDSIENKLEPFIIFLSDGDPTVGETNTGRIITHMSEKNTGPNRVPIHSLAFGDDADRTFLRKLSLRNDGFMRHIYEAADAALQLRDFYRQVSSPLLSDVKFVYPRSQIKEGSLSRSQFRTINDGSEVAVVGKIADDVNEITPQMLALRSDSGGRARIPYEINAKVPVIRGKNEYFPLERLWAYLTIKQLLDKRDAGDTSLSELGDDGPKESPEKKALAIALKFSFVTPLTSLVVVRLNKTDVKDENLVDAETVDEPHFLAYRHAAAPPIATLKTTYKAESTPTGLSIASDAGPVLFAVSSKRFSNGAYGTQFVGQTQGGYGAFVGQSHAEHSSSGFSYHSSSGQSSLSQGGYSSSGSQSQGGYSSSDFNPLLPDPGQVFLPPSQPPPLIITTTPTTTTLNAELQAVYHLEGYEWALDNINTNEDAFMWIDFQGLQVTLKLSKDANPPQEPGGDYECWPKAPANSEKGLWCVYLTRCLAARNYTYDDYTNKSCYVDNRYAGVCCPKNEIDRKL
ncbi:inter-alpha-trypsin inhibitor heavy chain H4 isoform X2 [Bicyclus anynana]|uniref:Inter-alpha-trypsin inhibitor heavy chain H4 isoform X2 n=1 Tax=Bicyclus anynana TaxID=110368 RepID=A0A6J1PAW6_BICAN|nr:inter-alpha-trypsin inhibitor heavy chain H4 isoform X2 [Bicyclus anynana]